MEINQNPFDYQWWRIISLFRTTKGQSRYLICPSLSEHLKRIETMIVDSGEKILRSKVSQLNWRLINTELRPLLKK